MIKFNILAYAYVGLSKFQVPTEFRPKPRVTDEMTNYRRNGFFYTDIVGSVGERDFLGVDFRPTPT